MAEIKEARRKEIIAAAQSLVADGNEKPTNQQVLDTLGKGSFSEIAPVMREWRADRQTLEDAAKEMPASLKESITIALAEIWRQAQKAANVTIENALEESKAKIEGIASERDEALAEVRRLEDRLKQSEETIEQSRQRHKEAETIAHQYMVEGQKAERLCAGLEAKLEAQNEKNTQLDADLKEARANNKSLQEKLVMLASGKE
jgi:DNA repair ATPase RecN